MKRVIAIIISIFVCGNILCAKDDYPDTITANKNGRYQSMELLKQKQSNYKHHKINTIKRGRLKIGNQKTNSPWYVTDAGLSEYGTKASQGFQEDHLADFEYEIAKAKDGFEVEYTLYKKQVSDWNTQLDKTGWKANKNEAGEDCVEVKVKKSDGSEGTLYGKLSEITETKTWISQGYVSIKENGKDYDTKEVDIHNSIITLYKEKVKIATTANNRNEDSTNEAKAKAAKAEAEKKLAEAKNELVQLKEAAQKDRERIEKLQISEAEKNRKIKALEQANKTVIDNANAKATREQAGGDNPIAQQGDSDDILKKLFNAIKTIVIVAIVAVVLIIAFVALWLLVLKKKKSHKIEQTADTLPEQTVMPPQSASTVVIPQSQPASTSISALQPAPTIVTSQSQPESTTISTQSESTVVIPQSLSVPVSSDIPPTQPQSTPTVTSPKQHRFLVPPAKTAFAEDADEWIIVGASVIGNGHISAKLPSQDNHKYENLGEGWGIAIVSDGAGSAEYSHIGSKIVTERGIAHFKALIEKEGWLKNNELPSDAKWLQLSYATLKAVHNDMDAFAKVHNILLKSLYATAIVVIHTPNGMLATHIGDGRAGYKNRQSEWKALITPHKGEEANQTIFVPSDFWNIPNYVMSGVLVPESVVIREKPFAFTLMSDGCESSAWQYYTKDETTGKFFDPNKPYPAFFDSLSETLQSFRNDKTALKERERKWANFITAGNESLKKELDDKTMILGVLYM
ncbi:MAG: protein phosphatase 2C domain-containing protein [Bacteroidales bacterium]|jgi:F0F1-type ATP synthase epsilon subunit|nr:protein phosphatase 2C domain-containing protein [Bacteroidales bacterium]